jgi:hypothetical protein
LNSFPNPFLVLLCCVPVLLQKSPALVQAELCSQCSKTSVFSLSDVSVVRAQIVQVVDTVYFTKRT